MVKHSTTVQDNVDLVNADKWNADHAGDLDLPFPTFTSKPTPSSTYLGRIIVVRSGSGVESRTYVCVLNVSDQYVWIDIGLPRYS